MDISYVHNDVSLEVPFAGNLVDSMIDALHAEDPGAKVLPYTLSGGTDNKSLSRLGITGYGFAPLQLPDELDFTGMFHGVDERVPADSLKFGARVLDTAAHQLLNPGPAKTRNQTAMDARRHPAGPAAGTDPRPGRRLRPGNALLPRGPRGTGRRRLPEAFRPASDGGLGLGLAAAAALQRRLATAAPATALAINMHLVWTGVAHVLAARGDPSLDFVLKEAAQGEVFAFGNSEAGNDSVLFDSRTEAAPLPDGGYSFTGHQDLHEPLAGMDTAGHLRQGPCGPGRRGGARARLHHRGTRPATGSCTTGTPWACAPASPTPPSWTAPWSRPDRIFRKLPVGPNADPLIFAIFACFETLLAAVYAGIGERALVAGGGSRQAPDLVQERRPQLRPGP